MEKLKNKIWRRNRTDSQLPTEPMETEERSNPEASYLVPDASTSSSSPVENSEERVIDPLTQQVDLLTEENARLQETIKDLTLELDCVKETQLSLISKSEDLSQSLELEKRRFLWQKKFYEKKILDLALSTGSALTVNGNSVNGNENLTPGTISDSFYHETISELVKEQEAKEAQISKMEAEFDEKVRNLKLNHESVIAEMIDSNNKQVKQLMETHEELIKDLMTGCEGLFDEMKVEYLLEAETNVLLKAKSGRSLWSEFQDLSAEKKGVIVAGLCIVTIATAGWASWGFIVWVWPRLLLFAESVASNPEMLTRWVGFLIAFLNSSQFQTFIKSWEEGQPLGVCFKSFLNTDVLTNALQLAPNLFSQLKNRSRGSQRAFSTI